MNQKPSDMVTAVGMMVTIKILISCMHVQYMALPLCIIDMSKRYEDMLGNIFTFMSHNAQRCHTWVVTSFHVLMTEALMS